MVKAKKIFGALFVFCFISSSLFAEKLVKPINPNAPYIMSNGGFAWSRVTRLQLQTTRSNFVWQDDLIGAYYAVQTGNMFINLYGKIAVQYPYHCEFNKVTMPNKQTILYGFDTFVGPIWTFDIWKIAKVDLAPGVHFRYQLSDKYHHCDLGIGGMVGLEFPFTKKFSLLLNGTVTYDYGNLGSNSKVQPFNHVWSYSADLGFRISKRGPNKFYYFRNYKDDELFQIELQKENEERIQKQNEKKAAQEEKNAGYNKELQEYKDKKKAQQERLKAAKTDPDLAAQIQAEKQAEKEAKLAAKEKAKEESKQYYEKKKELKKLLKEQKQKEKERAAEAKKAQREAEKAK